LSKVNAIRKKALDHVRTQNWPSAIKEYTRLADLDQSNPNVFNELGDIYLKTGNKDDAYDAFSRAIDSYTRVSLHNNAVAVCKKVLRLIPARYEVLTKLGLIRKKQGLAREAESYYNSYLDKLLVDQAVSPADVTKSCAELTDEMGDSVPVLAKVYDCLVKFNLKDETGDILQRLHAAYGKAGDDAGREETRQRMQELGMDPGGQTSEEPAKDGVVITEENIWSAVHTEGERIEVDDAAPASQNTQPIGTSEARPDSVYEYGDLEMSASNGNAQTDETATSTQTMTGPSADAETADAMPPDAETADAAPAEPDKEERVYDISAEPDVESPVADELPDDFPDSAAPLDFEETETSAPAPEFEDSRSIPTSAGNVHVSAIIGELGSDDGEMTDDDHRSHYDLGMAYLEMDLLAEAIREFQLASKSDAFQSRSLEMIGQCFLKQNQPNLAIKQLTKGLQLIGDDESETLGIKYNLGLAYEMIGDVEKALGAFEDVYVEDVTFREVAQKIEKYT
jgi:tetratricopeptide (TPR) repeat protein